MSDRHPPTRRRAVHGTVFRAVFAAASLALFAGAASAHAQDYTVTQTKGLWTEAPEDVVELQLADDEAKLVSLPFGFTYFGRRFDSVWVGANGFAQFGPPVPVSGKFLSAAFPLKGEADGIVAAFWADLDPTQGGRVWTTVSGAAPNRVFTIGWEDLGNPKGAGRASFQFRLHETSDEMSLSYEPFTNKGDWSPFMDEEGFSFIALDAFTGNVGDARSIVPIEKFQGGHPGADFVFSPTVITVTGKLLYDELQVTADGIGDTVTKGTPLDGLQAAITLSDGSVVGAAPIAGDGSFSIVGHALDSRSSGLLALRLENEAVRVVSLEGDPSFTVPGITRVSFAGNADLGTITLDATVDPDGTRRSMMHVARHLAAVHARVTGYVEAEVAQLEVLVNGDSVPATRFLPGDEETAPLLAVAGGPSLTLPEFAPEDDEDEEEPVSDTWDKDVLARFYARHVLAEITGVSIATVDDAFDAASDDENAFAVAFGHFLAAAMSGSAEFIDGIDPKSATVLDLEDISFSGPTGTDVASRLTAVLFDVLDAPAEKHDRLDHSEDPGEVVRVLEVIALDGTAATAKSFLSAWAASDLDANALARSYIHHEVFPDDAHEANDDASETFDLGTDGVRVDDLVLNTYNEDWFSFRLTQPAERVIISLTPGDESDAGTVTLSLLSGDVLLATRSLAVAGGEPVTLNGVSLGVGTYRVSAVEATGARLDEYTIQVHRAFDVDATLLPAWTQGRPFEAPIDVIGGIPPYAVRNGVSSPPPGLVFDAAQGLVSGVPQTPGQFDFSVVFSDAGRPQNGENFAHVMRINEPLFLSVGEFVAFPEGLGADFEPDWGGGTAPYTFEVTNGVLPDGVTLSTGTFLFGGAATTPGSTDFTVRGVDVAGSEQSASVRAVVCAPGAEKKPVAGLAAGDAATGFFVDAVAGSRVTAIIKTSKRREKRALFVPILLGDDLAEVDGGKRSAGNGKASAKQVVIPRTGRYFVITGSDDAGGATELAGKLKVAAPKRLAETFPSVGNGEQISIEIGALAGAKLSFSAKPAKRSEVELDIVELIDPDGNSVSIEGLVKRKGNKVSLKSTLTTAGTWTVVLGTSPGAAGEASYVAKIKQPKRGSFALE